MINKICTALELSAKEKHALQNFKRFKGANLTPISDMALICPIRQYVHDDVGSGCFCLCVRRPLDGERCLFDKQSDSSTCDIRYQQAQSLPFCVSSLFVIFSILKFVNLGYCQSLFHSLFIMLC